MFYNLTKVLSSSAYVTGRKNKLQVWAAEVNLEGWVYY